jgi:hypothetical protein
VRNAKKLEADPRALGPDVAKIELAGRAQQAGGGSSSGGGGGGGSGGGGGDNDNDGDDRFSWNSHFADPFGDFDFHDGTDHDPAPEGYNEHHVS